MTDLTTPRPVPTRSDRMRDATRPSFRTYTTQQERDRLDAEVGCLRDELGDALDDLRTIRGERDALRDVLADRDRHHTELHNRITVLENDLASQTRAVRELTAERDQARAELGAAQELIATVRDAGERIDRAFAAYETRQQQEPPPARLGSPEARAQDEPERTIADGRPFRWDPAENCYCGGPSTPGPHRYGTGRYCNAGARP